MQGEFIAADAAPSSLAVIFGHVSFGAMLFKPESFRWFLAIGRCTKPHGNKPQPKMEPIPDSHTSRPQVLQVEAA